jgi:hypothetical protein
MNLNDKEKLLVESYRNMTLEVGESYLQTGVEFAKKFPRRERPVLKLVASGTAHQKTSNSRVNCNKKPQLIDKKLIETTYIELKTIDSQRRAVDAINQFKEYVTGTWGAGKTPDWSDLVASSILFYSLDAIPKK